MPPSTGGTQRGNSSKETSPLFNGSGVNSVEGYRWTILQRIAELERTIQSLKQFHNSLSPAYRLPPEIVTLILLETKACTDRDTGLKGLSWLTATNVCKSWRTIALDTPSLWSELTSFKNPECTRALLKRSKKGLLSIRFYPDYWLESSIEAAQRPFARTLESAVAQVGRLRSIDLHSRSKCRLDFSEMFWSISKKGLKAPKLERLIIKSDKPWQRGIPKNFLNGGAPKLAHLEITQCRVHDFGTLPLGGQLKTLMLQLERALHRARPTMSELLNALERMPLLETLDLRDYLPVPDSSSESSEIASPTGDRYFLENLRQLIVDDFTTSIDAFVRCIGIPATAKATFVFHDFVDNDALRPSLEGINAAWDLRTDVGIDKLTLTNFSSTFTGTSYRFNFVGPGASSSEYIPPDLIVSFRNRGPCVNAFLNLVNTMFDLKSLTHLDADGSAHLSAASWSSIFGPLPKLRGIEFSNGRPSDIGLTSFLDATLGEQETNSPTAGDDTTSFQNALFPALSQLTLNDVCFDLELPVFSRLKTFAERHQSPRPKLELEVFNSENIDKEHYKALRKAADGNPNVELWTDDDVFMSTSYAAEMEEDRRYRLEERQRRRDLSIGPNTDDEEDGVSLGDNDDDMLDEEDEMGFIV